MTLDELRSETPGWAAMSREERRALVGQRWGELDSASQAQARAKGVTAVPQDFSDVTSGPVSTGAARFGESFDYRTADYTASKALARGVTEGTAGLFDTAARGVRMMADTLEAGRVIPPFPLPYSKRTVDPHLDVASTLGSMALRRVESGIDRLALGTRDYARTQATDREVKKHPIAHGLGASVAPTAALVAELGTVGPAGVVLHGAISRYGDPPVQVPLTDQTVPAPVAGGLEALAYTAAPVKAGQVLGRGIASPLARRTVQGLGAGTIGYALSDDPLVGLMTGVAGAAAPRMAPRWAKKIPRTTDEILADLRKRGGLPAQKAFTPAEAGLEPQVAAGQRAGSIGLDKFDGGNVRKLIDDTVRIIRAEEGGIRGEVKPWAVTDAAGKRIIGGYVHDISKILGRTPEEVLAGSAAPKALNEEQARALVLLVDHATAKADVALSEWKRVPSEATKAEAILNFEVSKKLIDWLDTASQTSGRTLSALKMRAKAGRPEQEIRAAVDAATRRYGGSATMDQMLEIAAGLEGASSRNAFYRTFTTLKTAGAKTRDAAHLAWLNGLLSGEQTHAINIGSNAAWQFYESTIERGIQATWGAARSGISRLAGRGPVTNRVYFGEIPQAAIAARESFDDALTAGARTFRTGESAFGGFSKIESGHTDALPRVMTPFTNLLQAEDEVFKWVAYKSALRRFAYREAVAKGVPLGQRREYVNALVAQGKHSAEGLAAANKYAQKMTFTEELGRAGEMGYRFARHIPGVRWVMPFMKTLTNIQKEGLRRSPLGLAAPGTWAQLAEGGAAADEALAKLTISGAGFGLAAWLAPYVAEGKIWGALPDDPGERNLAQSQGKMDYGFRIGDRNFSYMRLALEPWGTTIGTMVDMIQADQKGENWQEKASMAASTLYRNVVAKPGWSGLLDTMLAMREPEQFGERWINRFVASAVPNLSAQLARTMDPRRPDVRGGLEATIKSRIPGLKGEVEPSYSLTGEAETYGDALGGNLVSPFWAHKAIQDPVLSEMEKTRTYITDPPRNVQLDLGSLMKDSPQLNALRRMAESGDLGKERSAKLQKLIEGDSIELSPKGYGQFARDTSRAAHTVLQRIIRDEIPVKRGDELVPYSSLPIDKKQDAIRDIYSKAHESYVKQKRIKERMAERALKELGISPEDLERYME